MYARYPRNFRYLTYEPDGSPVVAHIDAVSQRVLATGRPNTGGLIVLSAPGLLRTCWEMVAIVSSRAWRNRRSLLRIQVILQAANQPCLDGDLGTNVGYGISNIGRLVRT